jgi:hypothetical protein
MARRLVDANTAGTPAANALKVLGLNARELQGMDADQRIAAIADRAKEMGLSAGEASRLLQDLGVRSREMALLMIQGGDAIRGARTELEELGLAFTPQQAATIERANDAMMRVRSVGEAISNQFAIQLAPIIEVVANNLIAAAKESGGFKDAIAGAFDVAVTAAGYFIDALQIARIGIATLTEAAAVLQHIWARLFDRESLDQATQALTEARNNLNSLLDAPPPSREFEKAVHAIRDAAVEAGQAMNGAFGGEEGGAGIGVPGLSGAAAITEKMNTRLEALIASLQTEQETIAAWYESGLEMLNAATEAELEALGGKHEAIERLNAEHQSRVNAMEEKAAAQRRAIQDQETRTRQAAFGQFWSNMTSLMNSGSRAMFNIGKVAAIAKGLIDMREAIMGAYKVGARIGGPPLGAAFAAAAGAAQAANLAAIKSTQFNGGGGSASAAGGGTVSSQALTGTGADANTRRMDQTIFLSGLDPSQIYRGSDLIDSINEAIRNGARINLVAG